MSEEKNQPISIFLAHATQDKPVVRELRDRLKAEEWIDPWLDEDKLSPGQFWTAVIEDALDTSGAVIIFLSTNSVQKEGFIQRELSYAWELSLEKPLGEIFLIPVRLDDCEIPRRLRSRQWVDYFGTDKEDTYKKLLRSLKSRHDSLLKKEEKEKESHSELMRKEAEKRIAQEIEERKRKEKEEQTKKSASEFEQEKEFDKYLSEIKRRLRELAKESNTPLKETNINANAQEGSARQISRDKRPAEIQSRTETTKTNSDLEKTKKRQLVSILIHILILATGWLSNGWMGVVLFSIPAYIAYYFMLYFIALALVPSPANKIRGHALSQYAVFVAYTWGLQETLIAAGEHVSINAKINSAGNTLLSLPGLIWLKSYQVALIKGIIAPPYIIGAGANFINSNDRMEQIFDLRTQNRISDIEVISRDGISFGVRLFSSFRLDPEDWDEETYQKIIHINPDLHSSRSTEKNNGSFPYCSQRILAAFETTSVKSDLINSTFLWDEKVIDIIEAQTRKTISRKNINDLLFIPSESDDYPLDDIANEIRHSISLKLRCFGIQLLTIRIDALKFGKDDDVANSISKQILESWESEWGRKREIVIAEAQLEAERMQQEARAYAESILLNSIAESLAKTQEKDPRLTRHVIAMRFLSALKDYSKKDNTESRDIQDSDIQDRQDKREKLQSYFREWQEQFFSHEDNKDQYHE
ncbi:MAG: TIR domain-containing protein [Anaerolineales bacterium]|nr:TIR domain-containing protein [Anaerolineales bacterium]